MNIPIFDLKFEHRLLREQLIEAFSSVLDTQQFMLGPAVTELEGRIAEFIGAKHAVGVASGTDALLLSLDACGVARGDQVIVPAFSFIASVDPIIRLGATPVFVDVGEDCNIDPAAIESAVTEKTKAIIPVHLYGRCADMTAVLDVAKKHDLFVIEDIAQSLGTKHKGVRAGALGHAGCFSFYPTKLLGGLGDGGMITTNDDELARRLRLFRDHGKLGGYFHEVVGYNSRLDSIQAACLSVKMNHLEEWIGRRIEIARMYGELFRETPVQAPEANDDSSVFGLYTIQVEGRDELRAHLAEHGIGSGVYYPHPLHLQPCHEYLGYKEGDFPVSEAMALKVLSLPMYPSLSDEQVREVARRVLEFVNQSDETR